MEENSNTVSVSVTRTTRVKVTTTETQGNNTIGSQILSSKVGEHLQKFGPAFIFIGSLINALFPHLVNLWKMGLNIWIQLQPYHPEEFLPLGFGLIMVFFGGYYFTLFAAIEAYRMCGYDQTSECLKELYRSYLIVYAENEKDNQVDDNNDGIADVLQIDSKELLTRKLSLILKSLDPVKVSNALSGVWMGFLGVVAVLKIKFAQAIALGATIGNIFQTYAEDVATPVLQRAIPEAHHKWIPIIISYFCKAVGVSIAWTIQRVMSAWYSSFRGAQIFTVGLVSYTNRNGYTNISENSLVNMVIVFIIAWTGFGWQIQSGFALPFPLNVLLFPITVVEWFIVWMVGVH